jgi:hypothetical protein
MKDLLEFMYINWTHCVFSLLVITLLWATIISGVRVLIETSIPIAITKIVEKYMIIKSALKHADTQIEEKYRWCPILYTRDYSEINNEYLRRMYDEALTKHYNFEKLFLSNYDSSVQQQICQQGNYWYNRFNGKSFY